MAMSGVRSSHLGLLAAGLVVFAWSAWHPVDYFIWFLEVVPAIVGTLVLIAIYPRFKFTDLVYVLVRLRVFASKFYAVPASPPSGP
jgi:putative membrane protein